MDRDEFTRLAAELRPRLHRYCARMVGSAFEGEDVVQETLAHAMEALPRMGNMAEKIENPEGWLLTHRAQCGARSVTPAQAKPDRG